MKRTIALILTLLLCAATAANTALAMTEEEALKAVKEAEGAYAPGDPLTMDDFKVYSSTTDFDRYDNNVLSFMKGERFGSYTFFMQIGLNSPTQAVTKPLMRINGVLLHTVG